MIQFLDAVMIAGAGVFVGVTVFMLASLRK